MGRVITGGWEGVMGVLSNVIRLPLALRNLHLWSPEANQYEDRVQRMAAAGSTSPLQQERLAWN